MVAFARAALAAAFVLLLSVAGYAAEKGPSARYARRHHHHLHLAGRRPPVIELHFRAYAGFGVTMAAEDLLDRALPHRTLIVHGREDQVIPVQTSLRLMELIDNADLSVFSHCGHWSMIERTADFNLSVSEFFSA